MNNKKLYRSSKDVMIAGVCGGISEYTGMDATVLRLLWVLVVIFTGFFPGILAYIVAAIVMPLEPTADAPKASPEEPKV